MPSWLPDPRWDQFSALLPGRPAYDPSHPLGCRRPRAAGQVIFEKLVRVLRFGCPCAAIAGCACGAATIRERRGEWTSAGTFAKLHATARGSCDRIAGLVLEELAVGGCITKAPGGGCAGPGPVGRRKPGMKRSLMAGGRGIPLGRVPAPASRRDSPLPAPALGKLAGAGPLPGEVTVRPGAGYDSGKTRGELKSRSRNGEITRKGGKAPIQAGQRWHVGRTSSRHSSFNRLRRCYERNGEVTDAFFGLAGAIITLRRLIREAWTLYRRDTRPPKRPWPAACPRAL